MKLSRFPIFLFFAIEITCCKQVYEPPAITTTNHFLVVDGVIVTGPDSTSIKLSRTRNLGDTVPPIPELQATVNVVGESGDTYPLYDQGDGRYYTFGLNLNNGEKYQLKINTFDGKQYESDFVPVRSTPPIDSLSWEQDSSRDVHVFLNTHDPQDNTKYYRWTYTETWQYNAAYQSYFDYVNEQVVPRGIDNFIYTCWRTTNSTDIMVGTTEKLSQDVISQYPITSVGQGSEKISIMYSINVNQYAITAEAYDYWQNLKKNTEQLGTLFDPQPSQVTGNLHCISNAQEPVLGYVSVSTPQSKRIFINYGQLSYWTYDPYYGSCFIDTATSTDQINQVFPVGGTQFYTFFGTDNGLYLYTTSLCGDCRLHGGTTVKPPFWP